jgi:hypothetical protein
VDEVDDESSVVVMGVVVVDVVLLVVVVLLFFGFLIVTLSLLVPRPCPLSPSMAFMASSVLSNMTKPYPLDR